jgi:hypothetical protein
MLRAGFDFLFETLVCEGLAIGLRFFVGFIFFNGALLSCPFCSWISMETVVDYVFGVDIDSDFGFLNMKIINFGVDFRRAIGTEAWRWAQLR